MSCPNSDMTCPLEYPLEALIQELLEQGHEPHHDDIDARFATSGLVHCSNCGGRGCFEYTGLRRGRTRRAFWSCRGCRHWIEV